MDPVALNSTGLCEEMERVIACRHPHLLPIGPDEIHLAVRAGESSSAVHAADQIGITRLWNRGCRLILLCEPALGLVEWVGDQLAGRNDRMAVFIWSERTRLLAEMAALHKRGRLDQPGMYWAGGNHLQAQLRQVFLDHSLYLLHPEAISSHVCASCRAETQKSFEVAILGLIDWFVAEREAHNRRFTQLRSARSDRPRIWSFAYTGPSFYIHGPMLCALGGGFLEAGVEAEICSVEPNDPALSQRLLDRFTRFCPTVFLSLNTPPEQAYRHFVDPGVVRSLPQPRLVWLVDHPRFSSRYSFGERDTVWASDSSYADAARSVGATRVVVSPPAADLDRAGIERDEFRAPVVFVGVFHDPTSFLDALAPWTRDTVEDLVTRMTTGEDVIAMHGFLADAPREDLERSRPVFEEFCRRLSRDPPDDESKILFVASVTASSRKRAETIRALLPFGVHVYGNEAWRGFLGDAADRVFRGPAKRDDLPDIYASAAININCHSPQLPRGLNARDFNVLRAGGCLLADYVADMDGGFLEPGRDLVAFRDTESLQEAVDRLLQEPDERRELAQSGRQTVLSKHLYRHRALWLAPHLEC